MSVKFELDNGKIKKYPTWLTDYGSEGYYPEKPYSTKCGLKIKKHPEKYACDHLECAIDAASQETIMPLGVAFSFFFIRIDRQKSLSYPMHYC